MPKTKPWRKLYALDLSSSFAGLDPRVRAAAYLLLGEVANDDGVVGYVRNAEPPEGAVLRSVSCWGSKRGKQALRSCFKILLEDGWLTKSGDAVVIRNFRRFQAPRRHAEGPRLDRGEPAVGPRLDRGWTGNTDSNPRNHSQQPQTSAPAPSYKNRTEQNRTEVSSDDDTGTSSPSSFEGRRTVFVREFNRRYLESTACGFSPLAHALTIDSIVTALTHSPGDFAESVRATLDNFFGDDFVAKMRNPYSINHLGKNIAKYRNGWNAKRAEDMSTDERQQKIARDELRRELECAAKLGINPDPDYIAGLRKRAGISEGEGEWN